MLGKRPDGYHELLTLFERVSLADDLRVELAPGREIQFTCDAPGVPSDSTNLAVRAAELFRQASGWRGGLRIELTKRVPAGGGLGGGSSDAASVLLALQRLSGSALSREKLMECARSLGADVAFFTADASWALGRDRGDRIEPLPLKASLWHLLVTPDFPIPTKNVYQGLQLTPPRTDVTLLIQALEKGEISRVRELLFNSLEPAVEALYPRMLEVKVDVERLTGLSGVMVSGSGSTVFAICDSQAQAERAVVMMRKERPTWKAFAASTC